MKSQDIGMKAGIPTFDNSIPLNAYGNTDIIELGSGEYFFHSPISVERVLLLEGIRPSHTVLTYTGEGSFIRIHNGYGCSVKGCMIRRTAGQGGAAIEMVADNKGSSDYSLFDDIVITSTPQNCWEYGVKLDGTQRDDGKGLIGLRDCYFNNMFVFNCLKAHISFNGVQNTVFKGGVFKADGADTRVSITSDALFKSNNVDVELFSNLSTLLANNTGNCTIKCPSIDRADTAKNKNLHIYTTFTSIWDRLKHYVK